MPGKELQRGELLGGEERVGVASLGEFHDRPRRQRRGERLDTGVERVAVAYSDADEDPASEEACVSTSPTANAAAEAYAPPFAARAWS